jgi:proteasome lid subunit RPN8/RPN11
MMSGETRNPKSASPGDGPHEPPMKPEITIREELYSELVGICLDALPHKAYGLVGGLDRYHPSSLYPCSTNLRNTPEWNGIFESFGEFHKNPDLGFVIDPSEVKAVTDRMSARRELLVGVFHSHRFLCVEPSKADIALSSNSDLFCYIVSVIRPLAPEVGIFSLNGGGFKNIPIIRL